MTLTDLNGDVIQLAKHVGLLYVSATTPGITRKRKGKGFSYVGPNGRVIKDKVTLKRIRSLVIPPAWEKVWICTDPQGHLQATGFDKRGRKQYRYHSLWRSVRDVTKYERMIAFGETLPQIRQCVERDLKLSGLPREKVLATVVRLLEISRIRVGNEEYAKQNQSYGLTTLRSKHVQVKGRTIHFWFRGKSGIKHAIDVNDTQLAKIVKRCDDLPGYELFKYYNEAGDLCDVKSTDVNMYLQEMVPGNFTAKDFRTWSGTVLAACKLLELKNFTSQTHAKRRVVHAIKSVAEQLGNTPAICKKCYIHPLVFEKYFDRTLHQYFRPRGRARKTARLSHEEHCVLKLLQRL